MEKNNIKISGKAIESMNNEQLLYCPAELYSCFKNPNLCLYDLVIIDERFEGTSWPSLDNLNIEHVHSAITLIKPSMRKNCLIYLHDVAKLNYCSICSIDKHCNITLNGDFEGVDEVYASEIKDLPNNSVVFTHDEFAEMLLDIKNSIEIHR